MLLTVTIFEPIAVKVGYDPIAFAIIGILAIEAGLLTPPFGLIVFTVKAAVDDDDVTIWEIFKSSTPYWVIMLIGVVLLALFPKIATWLPSLAFLRRAEFQSFSLKSRHAALTGRLRRNSRCSRTCEVLL